MLQVAPSNVVIIRSNIRRRCIVFETADPGLIEALGDVGQVSSIAGGRYQLYVSKLYQFGEVKKKLKSWPARPPLPELVAELTRALENALPHVQGVETAVVDQWKGVVERGRVAVRI
ncbi:MAG: hypothetical protein KC419_17350 [Anaerolineales bacterium]|nr:hypothetical protein [Anaerolineales bacterium]MCA9930255.1 hypothetical protein [Anaerolineales bacterium]